MDTIERYQLSVESGDAQRDLVQWLVDSKLEVESSAITPKPGEMGTAEIVTVLVSSGGLTALFRSINLWIKYRQPQLHVNIVDQSGRQVVVDSTNAGDIETLMKGLRGQ